MCIRQCSSQKLLSLQTLFQIHWETKTLERKEERSLPGLHGQVVTTATKPCLASRPPTSPHPSSCTHSPLLEERKAGERRLLPSVVAASLQLPCGVLQPVPADKGGFPAHDHGDGRSPAIAPSHTVLTPYPSSGDEQDNHQLLLGP